MSATEADLRRLESEIEEIHERIAANQNESATTLDALAEMASPKTRRALLAAAGYMFHPILFDRTLNSTQRKVQIP